VNKGLHIGVLFDVAEEIQQEETGRVIGEAGKTVFVGNNGADKGEVYEGRDKPGKPADNPTVRVDFDVSPLIVVF
jgi:hypothetical protein